MPSNHLVLYPPLLHLPSIFPSIRVFSNESALCIRWPKYWSFSSSISPSNEFSSWFPLGLTGLILQSKGFSRILSNTTVQKHQFFSAQLSFFFFKLKKFYWSIVDLQCCIDFCCTAKWVNYIYIYIYILLHILFHYDLSQDIEYNSVGYTVGPCCLSIPHVVLCIY